MRKFDASELKKLFLPQKKSNGEDNGQLTIIGGSHLFHGAPLFALKTASRIVDMVFFASPEQSLETVSDELKLKSELYSFIWVPWEEVKNYIQKSDAILIGPGFMRFASEQTPHGDRFHYCDVACQKTQKITSYLLSNFPEKKWVIDAGSLQVMEARQIPKNSIITPNKKEYEWLFGELAIEEAAKKHSCIIVRKGPTTLVCSSEDCVEVEGGNAGMTKGGTGDTQAGLTAALLAKNDPFLAAAAASFVIKTAADELYKRVGVYYNADDLAGEIPTTLHNLIF